MVWLKKVPGVSLILLLLTYGAEGWMYCSWVMHLFEEKAIFSRLHEQAYYGLFYGVAIVAIVFFIMAFTSPTLLMMVGLNNWLKSDSRAFASIILGALVFAIVVQRVDYFARFLVLAAAVFLLKLDLQLAGYSRWFCSLILAVCCWLGFTGGILAFYTGNP
jgi:hypothetical protein